jgi:hypothetical protein
VFGVLVSEFSGSLSGLSFVVGSFVIVFSANGDEIRHAVPWSKASAGMAD